jgi:ribosomal protein S18 acetylase RimI-like enzyme
MVFTNVEYSFLWPSISTIQRIMRDLSDHFTKKAVDDVEKDVVHEIICQYEDADLVGFIIFRINERECEILWMAIDLKHQGKRYGTSILEYLESVLVTRGIETIVVKTLDDSANYLPYHRTTKFYRKLGYRKIRFIEMIPEWGPGNPCAVYEKKLG